MHINQQHTYMYSPWHDEKEKKKDSSLVILDEKKKVRMMKNDHANLQVALLSHLDSS